MQKLFGGLKGGGYKYLVVTLLFVVPLMPKFPFARIPGSQVSLRLEDLVILVVGLVWAWRELPKLRNIGRDRVARAIVLFWFAGLVSLGSALLITQTVVPHVATLHWLRRVEYMMMFFIGYSAMKSRKDLEFFVRCLMLVVVYLFVVGVGQKHFGWPVITTQNFEYSKGIALRYKEGSHLVSTFAGHYDLATFLTMILPLMWGMVFVLKKKVSGLGNARMISLILMALWMMVNAASRISIVSYLGAVGLALLLMKRVRAIVLIVVVSLVFVGLSSRLIDRYVRIIRVTVERVSYEMGELVAVEAAGGVLGEMFEDRSTSIRLNMEWPRAIRAFTKNPILGTGYSSITLATDNGYLRMLGEVGLLGVAAFGLVVVRILMEIVKGFLRIKSASLEKLFLAGMIGGIVGVGLNMVFIDILEASKFAMLFWMVMGFSVAVARDYKK